MSPLCKKLRKYLEKNLGHYIISAHRINVSDLIELAFDGVGFIWS
jgi:hypothetical protein